MEEIKKMLIAACSDNALSGDLFFDECVGSFRSLAPFLPAMRKDPLYLAARDLCKLSDLETSNPYHNSMHTREAVYSALFFSCLQFSGCAHLRRRAALVCACAMAAHDLGHDGGINKDERMRLEIKAWNIAKPILSRRCADPHSKNLIRFCILSTDPSVLADRVQSYFSCAGSGQGLRGIETAGARMGSAFQKICGLICNGSDVCASALIGYGEGLGKKLSEEWILADIKTPKYSHGKDFAEKISTFTGRLGFLIFASGLADTLECFRVSGWHRHFTVQMAALAMLGMGNFGNLFGMNLLPQDCSGWVSQYGSAMKIGAGYLDSLDKQSSENLWLKSLEQAAAAL